MEDERKLIEKQIIINKNLINKLINNNKKLKFEKKSLIEKQCIENGHKWITEREKGPYGEKFTFCKLCKINLYGNSFYE